MTRKQKLFIYAFLIVILLVWGFWVFGFNPIEDRLIFKDNGDGSISEVSGITGLMWTKGQVGYGNLDTAYSSCDIYSFLGYEDWRLPTEKELETIIDYSRLSPAIYEIFSTTPHYPCSTSSFWSRTQLYESEDFYWGVCFYTGTTELIDYAENAYFKCVRELPIMETLNLIQNTETGAEFYLDKTINYGDILIIVFLLLFLIFGIVKTVGGFFLPKRIESVKGH